jgi:hypothetical protein
MRLDAFHLPALRDPPTTTWTFGSAGESPLEIRIPQLTPQLLRRQIDALAGAREAGLSRRPIGEILERVGRVADRFLDVEDPLRHQAEVAISRVGGLSRPMASHILRGMASDWRRPQLEAILTSDLGDPLAVDRFVSGPTPDRRSRAFGPLLTLHVFSGNVPGVSVTSLVRALLVKSASLAKTAAGEPILAALFAQALTAEDPDLGACLAVTYWPGGDESLEGLAISRADAVIAYGGPEAIASLRGRVPAEKRFLAYGHRVSFGMIGREAMAGGGAARLAAEAALAVATFDQQGCVSPHLFYVEERGERTPRDWASDVAAELAKLEVEMPRGALAPGEAAAIRQARGEAEFAGLAGRGHEVFASSSGTAWTVIFDPTPGFAPSCLNRLVRIKPVGALEEVPDSVAPLGELLQTVGIAAATDRLEALADRLGELGVSRIAPISRMAWPPATWRHDGRPPLADLVRWCDLEAR